MARTWLDQGLTAIRDAIRGVAGNAVTHVGLAADGTAYVATQTVLDPGGDVPADRLIKAATFTVVDATTIDALIAVNGSVELTGKSVRTIGLMKGAARGDALSRYVRAAGLGIGIEAADQFNIGGRYAVQDTS